MIAKIIATVVILFLGWAFIKNLIENRGAGKPNKRKDNWRNRL